MIWKHKSPWIAIQDISEMFRNEPIVQTHIEKKAY